MCGEGLSLALTDLPAQQRRFAGRRSRLSRGVVRSPTTLMAPGWIPDVNACPSQPPIRVAAACEPARVPFRHVWHPVSPVLVTRCAPRLGFELLVCSFITS